MRPTPECPTLLSLDLLVAAVALPHNGEPGALCQGTVISSMQKFRQCDGGVDEIGFILFATIE